MQIVHFYLHEVTALRAFLFRRPQHSRRWNVLYNFSYIIFVRKPLLHSLQMDEIKWEMYLDMLFINQG